MANTRSAARRQRGARWVAALGLGGLLSLSAQAGVAWAHPGAPMQPHDLWQAWNLSPTLLIGLVGAAWLYGQGAALRHARRGAGTWRPAAFAGGWLALVVALVSPLDRAAAVLFSAHMAQHMLLVLVAAPLLALSAPVGTLLLGLPATWRTRLGRTWRTSRLRTAWGWLSRPAVVWLLAAGVLWAWHIPAAYDAALRLEWLHEIEHVSLLGSALLFWWVVLHPGRRHAWLHGPGGTLFIFTQALQAGVLGALITFAGTPWYATYTSTTAAWGVSAMNDQQLAGAIMWIPAGVVYLVSALAVLGAWLADSEAHDEATADAPARSLPA